ncbi:MAG: putative sulfate exporter family transporter, partial [Candidatus Sericytochromatia bacterium]|nr:putative sulfate exporter family transporter [Candidatus Sericytochromatia bacterium]
MSAPAAAPPTPGGALVGVALAAVLAALGFGLAQMPGLAVMGPLSLALLLGIAWRATAGIPDAAWAGLRLSSRPVLRAGIVLMGARLDYGVLWTAGPKLLALSVLVITVAIVGMHALAVRVGLPRHLGMLLAVGTGICGASAVAAASSVTRASEEDTSLALAMMGLLGTAGVFFYIAVGGLLGLSPRELGVLTGGTLHEVAQVIAAAFTWGPVSGDMGTVVKLTRVVLLAPALLAVGWYWRRASADHLAGDLAASFSLANPPVPYFVLGFLAVGAANSAGWLPPPVQGALVQASIFAMAVARAAMGCAT